MNKLHLVELMQTTFNHLVVIMLGSDKVELMQTTFNIMLNIMLNMLNIMLNIVLNHTR